MPARNHRYHNDNQYANDDGNKHRNHDDNQYANVDGNKHRGHNSDHNTNVDGNKHRGHHSEHDPHSNRNNVANFDTNQLSYVDADLNCYHTGANYDPPADRRGFSLLDRARCVASGPRSLRCLDSRWRRRNDAATEIVEIKERP